MDDIWILNGTLITPEKLIAEGALHIFDGKIQWIGEMQAAPTHDIIHFIDAKGAFVTPGFIDLQINGGLGHDFTQNPHAIWETAKKLSQFGITSFLPTIISSPLETIEQAQLAIQEAPSDFVGSEPLGLHFEGPYINPLKRGAHPQKFLRLPDPAEVETWSPESGIRMVTMAPELDGASEVIETLTTNGVVVSAGHSLATYAEAQSGFVAGIRGATHLFNAMGPLHHRSPGLIGAVLDSLHIFFGLIADGVHLHPAIIRQLWDLGSERTILVSDCMAALGMLPGEYQLGEQPVIVNTRSARLRNNALAGSIQPLNKGLRNLKEWTNCSMIEAIRTVTEHPANLLNLSHKGRLLPGCDADLVIINQDFEILHTLIQGNQPESV